MRLPGLSESLQVAADIAAQPLQASVSSRPRPALVVDKPRPMSATGQGLKFFGPDGDSAQAKLNQPPVAYYGQDRTDVIAHLPPPSDSASSLCEDDVSSSRLSPALDAAALSNLANAYLNDSRYVTLARMCQERAVEARLDAPRALHAALTHPTSPHDCVSDAVQEDGDERNNGTRPRRALTHSDSLRSIRRNSVRAEVRWRSPSPPRAH